SLSVLTETPELSMSPLDPIPNYPRLVDCPDHVGDLAEDFAYLALAHDQRRRQRNGVAGDSDHQVVPGEGLLHGFIAAPAYRVGSRGQVDARGKTDAADIEHVGQSFESHCGVGPKRLERSRAIEQALVAIEVERGKAGGAGERMRRVGVAVEELDHVLGPAHERVVDPLAHDDASHRNGPGCYALCEGHDVGHDAVALGGKCMAQSAKAGDDLV